MGIVCLLDNLPDGVAQRPGRVWNVFARSLGEQGADGRMALAWRWALTGACPSPVTLGAPIGLPPAREELLAEAESAAEMGTRDTDAGGQLMHARFVLRWLAGELDALPLWNGGTEDAHVTDGADYAHTWAEIEQAYDWALLARKRHLRPGETAAPAAWAGFGWASGAMQLLEWVCGEASVGPLSRLRTAGRPTLYEVSLDVRRAMTTLEHARNDGDPTVAGRMEAVMETFLWLAGWKIQPPVDSHGHSQSDDCREWSCRGADAPR